MTTRIIRIGIAMSIATLLVLPATSAKEEKVSLDQVPAPVMTTVKARFGDAVVKGAGKEKEKGRLVYEITLEEKGHNVDVTLTPGGNLLLIERSVEESALPAPVAATLARNYPGATYRVLEEIIEVDHGREHLASYEVELVTTDRETKEVKVKPDGRGLTEEEEDEEEGG